MDKVICTHVWVFSFLLLAYMSLWLLLFENDLVRASVMGMKWSWKDLLVSFFIALTKHLKRCNLREWGLILARGWRAQFITAGDVRQWDGLGCDNSSPMFSRLGRTGSRQDRKQAELGYESQHSCPAPSLPSHPLSASWDLPPQAVTSFQTSTSGWGPRVLTHKPDEGHFSIQFTIGTNRSISFTKPMSLRRT